MKSILYVGATLMIGASIYGFVDYKKTNHNKEFADMYDENEAKEPLTIVTKDRKEAGIKKESVSNEKPVAKDEKNAIETKNIKKTIVDVKISKKSVVQKKEKKKRRFNSKLFSRGALDERYVEPKEKVKVTKEEVKKIEVKEQ